ncbi:histidine--tRNA ligase [Chelatococcus sp. GCM10030263]|uniref:histidine--tRNA ligase n=1 Tax=Chelatococcus sp. GCM10030263 TaxID=3273387 RepID=UPI003610BD5A
MSDTPKPQKLLARLPRGFADRGPGDVAATERMLAKIRETYELYGFEAVETPFVEFTDALGKFLPDQDRPNEGVFSFQDDDEQWLSLRYDLTAPLARYVAENFDALPKPYRSYRAGWVFRNEKPGPGRFRQFMQFDADTVGAATVAADAEICMMAADTLERVGIKRGDYVIKVNNRKVLDGVLEAIGLGGEENAGRRLTVLRAIDKLDKVGPEGVRDLLGKGRMDPSGDFTKGAELDIAAIDRVLAFTSAKGARAEATLANLAEVVAGSPRGTEGVAELKEIAALVVAGGYDDGRVVIDPAVVRGLEYYTGPVYEAELTFEVTNDEGQIVRFGSVAGGGRYDGLVSRFRGEPVPATGFSIGVSRLLAALKAINSPLVATAGAEAPVVVLVMDRSEIAHYQQLVGQLRAAGIRSELYLGSSGMKAQMKYADRRGSRCVVIQGSDERAKGEVTIKDLVLGAELAGADKNREDYLARQAEAQFAVPEAQTIEAVKKVLARHR